LANMHTSEPAMVITDPGSTTNAVRFYRAH
jgi:hypothetical protein